MSEAIVIKSDKSDDKNDNIDMENSDEDVINDFPSMIKEFFGNIPWKLSLIMFMLLLVLFSKQFIESVLDPLGKGSWVDGDSPTNTGTIVLCIFAIIGLIIADLLIKVKIL